MVLVEVEVCLAMLFMDQSSVKEPIILRLATSAIDARNAKEILRTVTKVDATVIVIAHNLTNDTRRLFNKEIKLSDQNV